MEDLDHSTAARSLPIHMKQLIHTSTMEADEHINLMEDEGNLLGIRQRGEIEGIDCHRLTCSDVKVRGEGDEC